MSKPVDDFYTNITNPALAYVSHREEPEDKAKPEEQKVEEVKPEEPKVEANKKSKAEDGNKVTEDTRPDERPKSEEKKTSNKKVAKEITDSYRNYELVDDLDLDEEERAELLEALKNIEIPKGCRLVKARRTKRVSFLMHENSYAKMKAYAERNGKTVTKVIEKAVDKFIKEVVDMDLYEEANKK